MLALVRVWLNVNRSRDRKESHVPIVLTAYSFALTAYSCLTCGSTMHGQTKIAAAAKAHRYYEYFVINYAYIYICNYM